MAHGRNLVDFRQLAKNQLTPTPTRALIRTWRPWEQSTGPKTEAGKARAAHNAFKGGLGASQRHDGTVRPLTPTPARSQESPESRGFCPDSTGVTSGKFARSLSVPRSPSQYATVPKRLPLGTIAHARRTVSPNLGTPPNSTPPRARNIRIS